MMGVVVMAMLVVGMGDAVSRADEKQLQQARYHQLICGFVCELDGGLVESKGGIRGK